MDSKSISYSNSINKSLSVQSNPNDSSITSLDLQTFLDNCDYSSQSLSTFPNRNVLKPIILIPPSTQLSNSTYSPILQNSSRSLKNICDFKSQYEGLIMKNFLKYQEPQCSDCKKSGIFNLKCGHFNCSSCIYLKSFCSICNRPKSFYDLELDYYICLKCKKFKKHQENSCKHYCTECIFSILRVKKCLKCDICSIAYSSADFLNNSAQCEACGKTGMRFEDWFMEICDNHLVCYSCVQRSIENFGCMVCGKRLKMKEVYDIKKKMKIFCEVCMKLRKIKDAQQKECCDSIQCKYCFTKYNCLNCKS